LLEEVFQLKKSKSKKEDEEQAKQTESFEIIDTTSNKKKDNVPAETTKELFEMNEDFEHLSQYDPDDEFLRSNKSVSIIDSILSKKAIS